MAGAENGGTPRRWAPNGEGVLALALAISLLFTYFATQLAVSAILLGISIWILKQPLTSWDDLSHFAQDGLFNGLVILMTAVVTMLLTLAAIRGIARGSVRVYLALAPPRRVPVWMALVGALALVVVLDLITLLLQRPLVPSVLTELYRGSFLSLAVLVVAVVLAAPAMEEVLFRGLLYTALEPLAGTATAVGITAVLFGVIHVSTYGADWYSVVQTLVMGLFLTVVRAQSGSLWPAVAAHVMINLYSTTQILVLGT